MHPAYSVILFTTASGAGYGLLVWLGVLSAFRVLPADRWLGFTGLAISLALITVGLLASTFHLGHPERAWRAFSQWRSSWLSREGVAAVATYVPAGLLGIGWVFLERTDGIFALMGLLAAALALVTVYCTGMIYASLRTIRQWNQPLVPWIYIALALATGGLLMLALMYLFGTTRPWFSILTAALVGVALLLKQRYWATIDSEKKTWTIGDATGLGKHGQVRVLDFPHTQANFVMREMGFAVARNHAEKLRGYVRLLAFLVPGALCLITLAPSALLGTLAALLAVVAAGVGVAMERWLFFAEAEHVSMLYYGRPAA
ncbi:DmsC/YnfH family molybdoenzyme membrane anchor subunit [Hyphomicrobium sp. CS1BSMeth3]|uniref:dimethyl sulfoxide reductase anchor subunit family protein n=1 Tax=Hyphomicrobium sp. CS1BSMeth3 TaxID=1892844 RepID=UPI0009301843|nr:DmsC/YnfH family molybdoenzyme membrane anchor subunit [Hyphomicrobium sp. CS1BSMeth3]